MESKKTVYDLEADRRYLEVLARQFPTIADASTEIINLQAIMNLPKGTEHFLADIHGENEAFQHVLKNASGNVLRKVNDLFADTLSEVEIRNLCTLIYYPEQKLRLVKREKANLDNWYRVTIHRLVVICRDVSSKYTRSKVRKTLPTDFSYIIQELLHEHADAKNKIDYVGSIISTIIEIGRADQFIIAISNVIQRLVIDQLHILGDVYDRGPGAHTVLDVLASYHDWDITWGNHDVLWMGACAGNDVCICNVVRIALRYDNMLTLEDGYGINLVNLATFAMDVYGDDPCQEFLPKVSKDVAIDDKSRLLIARMHKAISVIQFKLEAALVDKHPLWKMGSRKLPGGDRLQGWHLPCRWQGLQDALLPLPHHRPGSSRTSLRPRKRCSYRSSTTPSSSVRSCAVTSTSSCAAAACSRRLNGNLLYHASIPLNADGSFKAVEILPGKSYKGRELLYHLGMMIRSAFQQDCDPKLRQEAIDYFCYLWCGPDSPLFDKAKMATFERYFLAEKETHKENKGFYYALRDDEATADRILDEFEVEGKNRHIINGHVPVHVSKGESPIKAGGKLMVIDGGFAQAYHKETGIAGYTLVYHSRGFQLVQHEPFTSTDDAIKRGTDIRSTTQIVEMNYRSLRVADTDKGKELRRQIEDLQGAPPCLPPWIPDRGQQAQSAEALSLRHYLYSGGEAAGFSRAPLPVCVLVIFIGVFS